MTSFRVEVKPTVQRCKILQHVKDPYIVKEILVGKIHRYFLSSSPVSPLVISAGYYHRGLMSETGMIRTQVGTHNRSVMVAVYGTPCAIPPCEQ
jgi:hypothetical protein